MVTVAFVDVAGSTALGERLDPESTRRVMVQYFELATDVIEQHGGIVEKFIGDAVMAVFGLPVAHEDDALRAVRAAAQMRDRLGELAEALERRFAATIGFRIGVTTGEVVAGDASTRQAIVTGDAVNVAARLEQRAGTNEILLGEQTYQLVANAVSAEPVDPIDAKGKAEPVPAYRLLAVDPGRGRPRRADRPLVGRVAELEVLRRGFDQTVAEHSCRLLTVVGEPGVGKSRLARELLAALGSEARVLEGRCLSYGEGITYWPVAEVVKEAADIRDEESQVEARAKLAELVSSHDQGARIADRVARAIGLAEGQATSAEEIAWAIRSLLATLAREQSLLLVIDDIQWAEPALVDLLASLPERIDGVSMLCLCLGRPEFLESRTDWNVTIELGPLDDDDAAALLPASLAELREKIVRTAGGNPLFIEELGAFLADQADTEALPASLAALLGARLDRLPTAERSVLERAAIEGEIFHAGALTVLSQRDVSGEVDGLRRRDLVRAAQAQFVDETALRFRHILVREAAYGATTKALRAELHERFADWLEEKAGARVAEVEEILGYHLEQAHRYMSELGTGEGDGAALGVRAGRRLASAGLRAIDRDDLPAAVNLLSRAAALLPGDAAERLLLMLRLGNACVEIGEYARAVPVFSEVAETAERMGERRLELRASLELVLLEGFTENPEGQGAKLVALANEAIPIYEQAGDDEALARAWHLVSHDDWAGCRWGPRAAALERGLVHAERSDDSRSQAELTGWLATAIALGPTPAAEGLRRCEELLERAAGHRAVEAHVRGAQAVLTAMQGRFPEARQLYQASRGIYAELGLLHWEAGRTSNGALVELIAGDAAAAERELRWGADTLEAMGERNVYSTVAALLAGACAAKGDYEEALRAAQKSEDVTVPGDIMNEIFIRLARARALAHRGELDEAERLAREALGLVEQTDMLQIHGDTLLDLADVVDAAGREGEAGDALKEALALYERKENVVSAARARERIGRLAVPG
jgi:class 3 adenylate cyclase/tetratricopeptide (TPR) repeat protein